MNMYDYPCWKVNELYIHFEADFVFFNMEIEDHYLGGILWVSLMKQ